MGNKVKKRGGGGEEKINWPTRGWQVPTSIDTTAQSMSWAYVPRRSYTTALIDKHARFCVGLLKLLSLIATTTCSCTQQRPNNGYHRSQKRISCSEIPASSRSSSAGRIHYTADSSTPLTSRFHQGWTRKRCRVDRQTDKFDKELAWLAAKIGIFEIISPFRF